MGNQEIFVTVADVTSKSGTSKTGKPYTLYQVTLSDGNTYKTFKNEVATAAQQLKTTGRPSKARVHSEKSQGDYPDDLFIDGIEPATTMTPAQSTEAATITTPPASISNPAVLDTVILGNGTPQIRDRNEDILTMFAIKSATHYVASNGTGDAEKDLTLIGYMAQEIYTKAVEGVQGVGESKKELPTW